MTAYSATGRAFAAAAEDTSMPRSQQAGVTWPRTLPAVWATARSRGAAARAASSRGGQPQPVTSSSASREHGAGVRGGEVVEHGPFVQVAHAGEGGAGPGSENGARRVRRHGECGPGTVRRDRFGEVVRWGHLTAPAVRPERQNRCSSMKAAISGRMASNEPLTTTG